MVSSFLRWVVLTRDDFTCQNCGRKGVHSVWRNYDLDAHHIDGNRKNNTFKNQITLCEECHFKSHGRNWKQKPTRTFTVKAMREAIIREARQTYDSEKTPFSRYLTETIETEEEMSV